MRVEEGSKAPIFEVKDLFENKILLENYTNKRLLLSFYRYASCPLCNLRIAQLIQHYDELSSKGLSIIAFFQSPKESIQEYVGKQDVPFAIIPDPERRIYRLYGIESSWFGYIRGGLSFSMIKALMSGFMFGKMEGRKNLLPADFLIEDLVVKRAYYGKKISDHIPLEEILTLID